MKPVDRREIAAALLPAALLGAGALLALAVVHIVPDAEGRLAVGGFALGLLAAGAGTALRRAYLRSLRAAARLAEEAQALQAGDARRTLASDGAPQVQALAVVLNRLLAERAGLREDVAAQVQAASRSVEQERNRLAALMAELTQSVVVCNLDGRILLYNNRARWQLRALSAAAALGGASELVGLGRSIYALLDRALIAHALDSVQQRLARGAAHPSAQFVTGTHSGQLLRVQLAPVREAGTPADAALDGFVLMLDNVTRDFAAESERDRLLHALGEGSRASLGNVQAALEMLDFPDLDAATRERFMGVVRDEVRSMAQRLQDLARHSTQAMKTRWPLEDMLAADLVAAACRRIEAAAGCRAAAGEVAEGLWLQVDSYSLIQALASLAARLVDEVEVRLVRLRVAPGDGHARLDLVWQGPSISTETVIGWETEPMRTGGQSVALTVRDVVERHGGEFWFERDRARGEAFFRLLVPLAAAAEPIEAAALLRGQSRPEVYDFDLFRSTPQARERAQQRLVELAYTVFDTETTGLAPAAGDEILQIGATRIVAGKLRREDCFEQLVDPQRDIPPAGIPIHGIRPEMVAGAPTIDEVLPAFHAWAADTVLVAHNAAFDMRFLELKQARTGVVFSQPVLDTLLLSAVVHPSQASHGLEAIAERLGVPVLGRHTALGDAMVTAEVFLKLIPLLAEHGIHTLGQALEASQRTYLARVSY
ncbi:MAG TPA: exonuclease domain-containing protein [Burkholderiaceae bacterium]|nr:exonuclease domain-containing protein [Burkholderiaceae bacterium]